MPVIVRHVQLYCAVTTMAFLAGYADILLTIPSHPYTPILSVSFGLLVGVLYIWGLVYIPCLFIGMFGAYYLGLPAITPSDLQMNMLQCSIVVFGSACCILVLKKYFPQIRTLHNRKTILLFFLYTAIITGGIIAMIVSYALYHYEFAKSPDIFFIFVLHWLANILAVATLSTIAMICSFPTTQASIRHKIFCVITASVLLLIVGSVFMVVKFAESNRIQDKINSYATHFIDTVNQKIDSYALITQSVEAFMHSSTTVESQDFVDFVGTFNQIYDEIRRITWSPLLKSSELPVFAKHISSTISNYPSFEYQDIFSEENRIISPLTYMFSSSHPSPPIGFNLLESKNSQILQAFDYVTGLPYDPDKATKSKAFYHHIRDDMLTFYFSFHKKESGALNHNHFNGIISISINAYHLFDYLYRHEMHQDIYLTAYDLTVGNNVVLYRSDHRHPVNSPRHTIPRQIHYIHIGNLVWALHFSKEYFPFSTRYAVGLWGIFILIIFILIGAQLYFIIRSQYEDALIEREAMRGNAMSREREELELILDSMDARIWIKDNENRIVRLNQKAAESMHGIADDFVGKSCKEVFPYQNSDYLKQDQKIILSGKSVLNQLEHHQISKDKYEWLEINKIPYCNLSTQQTLLFTSARNVTNQKKEQDILRHIYLITQNSSLSHQEKINTILDHTIKILEVDIGTIAFLQDMHYVLKHIRSHEADHSVAIGQILDMAEEEPSEKIPSATKKHQYVIAKHSVHFVYGIPLYVGSQFFGVLQFFNYNDRPCKIAEKLQDTIKLISQFIAHEINLSQHITELQSLSENLQNSNEELQNFARVLAHDLKTPTRVIRQFIDLIATDIKEQRYDMVSDYFTRVTRACHNMDSLINALSDHTRLDGEVTFSYEDGRDIFNTVLENIAMVTQDREVMIDIESVPESIYVNKPQIIQLLENLISNSIKYCEEEIPTIYISAQQSVETTLFSLRDNGIGIKPEDREVIFERFKRLHNTTKYVGTGLGLSTCKQIVQHHGGRIWCEANPEGGTIFNFIIRNSAPLSFDGKG